MKKFVKPLVIAASVAAIAGIGAVSFAAWQGATTADVNKTGATGEIATLGALSVVADSASLDGDNLKPLVPADQGTVTGAVNYWKFTVTLPDATGDANPTFKLAGTLSDGSDDGATEVGGAKLYWLATAPNATTPETTNEVKSSADEITLGSDGEIYIYLVATGTDAMLADISLTFSAA